MSTGSCVAAAAIPGVVLGGARSCSAGARRWRLFGRLGSCQDRRACRRIGGRHAGRDDADHESFHDDFHNSSPATDHPT